MTAETSDAPPSLRNELAAWFAEAVRSEIAELEKSGGAQTYEVLSGRQFEQVGPGKAIYQFLVADGTRIPEDASGKLKTMTQEFPASVVSQDANRICILVEGNSLPKNISRAVLLVDDTALLKKLEEVLGNVAANPNYVSHLAGVMFHPNGADVSSRPVDSRTARSVGEEKARIIAQSIGSSLTYIWGPPGTGKTHLIAHLVSSLVEGGERVLVTSHTHAAVDQALHAAVRTEGDPGPLSDSELVRAGKILRIGRSTDPKIPETVLFDKVLEAKARELTARIAQLEHQVGQLREQSHECQCKVAKLTNLASLIEQLGSALGRVKQAQEECGSAELSLAEAKKAQRQARDDLARAERAWLFRAAKIQRAASAVRKAEGEERTSEVASKRAERAIESAKKLSVDLAGKVAHHRAECMGLPSREELESQSRQVEVNLREAEDEIVHLNDRITQLGRSLIQAARAIFCTLTKNYLGQELEGQTFDAVVADEVSMALPPMLFLAAGRANSRLILVGDFLQLPPIIRSDIEISNHRLGTDVFHLSGVARDLKPTKGTRVLARLSEQRRMAPAIAEVARHLVYRPARLELTDHDTVKRRATPGWLSFLPDNPLIIVDTADLHCWCGKQPGTLSRFNFYSATVAVELAASAAGRIPSPSEVDTPPIGIVTPYAAQRRLLGRLVEGLGLPNWTAAGTVHTFQGGQAPLIIFDSVLDEPYYSARLCTPDLAPEVLRQINVAVTRAQYKFVFVGSSEWLNRSARPTSGLGRLWQYLKANADLISVSEVLKSDAVVKGGEWTSIPETWSVPLANQSGDPIHEILDETTFFERFEADISSARESIFGLVPYFGEYRWPTVEPVFRRALKNGVEVTLVIPPLLETENRSYVEGVIANLRDLGAVVVASSGLHGKDVIIDSRIHYTGSLNWASHRGRSEVMHRTEYPPLAHLVLEFLQAKYIRAAATYEDGKPRTCPQCHGPVHVVNQRVQGRFDFRQALKAGCMNYLKTGCKYLRNVDERAPFREPPRCEIDGRTRYRRVKRGRGEIWQCPKHPRECHTKRVVPGDP